MYSFPNYIISVKKTVHMTLKQIITKISIKTFLRQIVLLKKNLCL